MEPPTSTSELLGMRSTAVNKLHQARVHPPMLCGNSDEDNAAKGEYERDSQRRATRCDPDEVSNRRAVKRTNIPDAEVTSSSG